MARIAGVDLPNDKRIEIALTYVYGIGRATARKILDTAGVSGDIRVKNHNSAILVEPVGETIRPSFAVVEMVLWEHIL